MKSKKRYVQLFNDGGSRFICPKCNENGLCTKYRGFFKTLATFKRHLKIKHSNSLPCNGCIFDFRQSNRLIFKKGKELNRTGHKDCMSKTNGLFSSVKNDNNILSLQRRKKP